MRVLGVDPGATGALAMLDTDLSALVVVDMPSFWSRPAKPTGGKYPSSGWRTPCGFTPRTAPIWSGSTRCRGRG